MKRQPYFQGKWCNKFPDELILSESVGTILSGVKIPNNVLWKHNFAKKKYFAVPEKK
jgi:hypothetical protein